MRLLAVAAGLLALSVASAWAWPQQVQTRFGVLEIVPEKVDEALRFAGHPVYAQDGSTPMLYHSSVEGVWQIGEVDVALIASGIGGSGPCVVGYLLVVATVVGAEATVPFRRCGGTVTEVRPLGSRLEFDYRTVDPRFDHVAVIYAQGRVTETAVPLPDSPATLPGGGAAVTRWDGVHSHEIVRDAGERQRFYTIMPKEKLFELMDRMHVGSGAAVEDGWLIATGNMPHQGCVEMGGFAIEIATGRAEAAMFHKGRPPELFGGALADLHPAMQEVAQMGSARCPP